MTDRKETRMSESMWYALRDLIENGNTEMDRAMRALCRRGFVDAESISVTKQGRWVYNRRLSACRAAAKSHSWRRISGPLAKQVLAEAEACGEPVERGDSLSPADVRECRKCKAFRFNTKRRSSPVYLVPRFWVESKPWGSRVVGEPGPCGRHPESDTVEPWRADRPNVFEAEE